MEDFDARFLCLNNDEIELLCSCVGKELVGVEGTSFLFSDDSIVSISHARRFDVPFDGDDGIFLDEGGVFRVSKERLYQEVCDIDVIAHEDLPVPHIVRKVYVLNEAIVYAAHDEQENPLSFIHTYGIVLGFSGVVDEEDGETMYYYYLQQISPWGAESLDYGIAANTFTPNNQRWAWGDPNLYSTSMIRVG